MQKIFLIVIIFKALYNNKISLFKEIKDFNLLLTLNAIPSTQSLLLTKSKKKSLIYAYYYTLTVEEKEEKLSI